MNSCLLPGNDYPVVVLIGASGTGKTCVGRVLAEELGAPFIESEEVAEDMSGLSVTELFNRDLDAAHTTLNEAAAQTLAEGGPGAAAVVALSPSAVLDPNVQDALREAKRFGAPIIALEATLQTLASRTGLNAQRPVFMGTPRAWFRRQIAELEAGYEKLTDLFVETDYTTCEEAASSIAETVRLHSNEWL